MSLDVKVLVLPETAFTLASSLSTAATTVGDAEATVTSARSLIQSENTGLTATAAETSLGTQSTTINTLSSETSSLSTAVNAFAQTMSSIKTRLDDARARASEAGLVVSGDLILEPEASDPDYEEKQKTYSELDEDLSVIRQDESTAHDDLQAACQEVSGVEPEGPGGAAGAAATANTAYGWASRGVTVARWAEVHRRGTFAPATSPTGLLSTLWQKTKLENWVSKAAHQKPAVPGNWRTQPYWRLGTTAMKWFGRASGAVSGGLGGLEQYQKDSANPSMGEGEKIARAGTQAVAQGAGGYYGAAIGAQVGATIGALGGPLGIAAGTVIGGAIGGFMGSKAGKTVADAANKVISKLFH
ncbi:hypothetical protein D4740_12060 [Actinomyces sp. 2119]|uniref:hypothetical protein n=1 Tax=Actinomyces sp. 2119 TaxID=2321393 RepID=UPI000E6BFA43|nr:hypothetical protein [Actinomyces sp. 2119]RJF40386.1 hypothetical protein D4740_12060 [Actinomyces sp. 2119]